MIGIGLFVIFLLLGLRVAWHLLRLRGLGIFVAMVGIVAYAAIGRAGVTSVEPETTPTADLVTACQQVETGLEACTRAIESTHWPEDELSWAYNNRGLAYAATGDLLNAIKDHSKAIELSPEDPAGWTNRGNAHATLGDLIAALADHQKAVELAPDLASTWHNRGVDYEDLGEHRKALEDYRRALTLDPRHVGSHLGIATANCKLSRVNAAVKARLAMLDKGLTDPLTLQRQLKQDGFYAGPLDGLFGKGSRAALRAWIRRGCLAQA